MTINYIYQGDETGVAKAAARDLAISTKTATMVAQFLAGKTIARARADLDGVLAKKTAVPFTRFTEGAGHKPGIGPGKYPEKAALAFKSLLNSAVANAEDIGLSENLYISFVAANQGVKSPKYGRHRGRTRKATHIEIVVAEEKEDGN